MSLARCCDRCGKLYKMNEANPSKHSKNGKTLFRIDIQSYGNLLSFEKDLCDECSEEFKEFLNAKKEVII